jgi:hypothetical protein
MLVGLLAGCGGSPPPSSGTGEFGAAPSAAASSLPSSSPGPSGSAGTDRAAGDLRASYTVTKALLGAKSNVSLTLTNKGIGDVNGWTVIMGLYGLALALTIPDEVKHDVRDGKHVFTPNGRGAVLGPGDEVSFTFSATGLGSVTSCTANGRDCVSA